MIAVALDHLHALATTAVASAPESDHAAPLPIAEPGATMQWAGWILWLPVISLVLCGLCAALRVRTKLPAWLTVACLGASFLVTLGLYFQYDGAVTIELFRWFDLHWAGEGVNSFVANFGLYVDRLTLLWMLFVTGLGTLIALYASEYMEADVGKGYARFFAGVSVFLFAMSCLVMGDNLLMLYLGWEGVGFASYWLIGYYYERPSAVAAAKKAFIVNRIGDLGLALGIYLTWRTFGTVEFVELFHRLESGAHLGGAAGWTTSAIPFLFMLGAFGKSAQIPLYVWLPDAMEGPTPVSALIHAATMVTAGVYLLCRVFPLLELHALALPAVAWIGGLTALLAATIGVLQYDIKRIMAYSTVSQLGYMFLGIGVMTTYGAAYHVFTHAFFKAVLFLTCGAIMHGFAGQLDLRKLSGLRYKRGWGITCWTMFYACLCLAGFPLISSGFYSKDLVMAQAFITPGPGFVALGWIAIATAFLTAYYAFRVWFRLFTGEIDYEMGDEHHGDDEDDHGHRPHPPGVVINLVLVVISIGAVLSILASDWYSGWAEHLIADSSAAAGVPAHGEHADAGFWHDPHAWMPWVASIAGLLGLAIAWYFHALRRDAADTLKATLLAGPATRWLPLALENKWYVDELYHALLRAPLWTLSHAFNLFDRYIVDGLLVNGTARLPRLLGRSFQPLQNGVLQSYAVAMAGGAGLIVLLVLYMRDLVVLVEGWIGGAG